MNPEPYRELIETFAKNHVQKSFRERFVHEIYHRKATGKLMPRICHHINDVFPEHYRDGACPFEADEPCIPITGSGIDYLKECLWGDIQKLATPGFGLLVISLDAKKFFAETEFEFRRPSVSYSSSEIKIHCKPPVSVAILKTHLSHRNRR